MSDLTLFENGLIKVYATDTGELIVDGRELWEGVGSKQEFTNWIKNRLNECDAVENEDYSSFDKIIKREKGATTLKEYYIKLDTAKEMAMLERNEVGKQYRKYLIATEKKYKQGETAHTLNQANRDKILRAEAMLRNAKSREASIYMKIAEQVGIPEYKQIMYCKATEVLDGQPVLPLPRADKKTYTATEIGEQLGISANRVGKLTNSWNLKTDEYGIEVWDKSPYSSKQVPAFRYYENVIPVLKELLRGKAANE